MDERPVYPYHRVPDVQDENAVAIAFADCFNTPAGQTVLNRLYWGYVMAGAALGESGQRQLGKIEMFREVIDMMQKGENIRRGR